MPDLPTLVAAVPGSRVLAPLDDELGLAVSPRNDSQSLGAAAGAASSNGFTASGGRDDAPSSPPSCQGAKAVLTSCID